MSDRVTDRRPSAIPGPVTAAPSARLCVVGSACDIAIKIRLLHAMRRDGFCRGKVMLRIGKDALDLTLRPLLLF